MPSHRKWRRASRLLEQALAHLAETCAISSRTNLFAENVSPKMELVHGITAFGVHL